MKDTNSTVYGVEQSNHGHNYRWIFDEETLRKQGINLTNIENGIWEDIGFPIGGSNSSATSIVKLNTLGDVRIFLLSSYCTDYDDPKLVDIAEGLCSIDVGDGSITQQFVDQLQIPPESMTKENGYLEEAKRMISELKENGADCNIDYDSPFYGESRGVRLSELREIYQNFTKKEDLDELESEYEENF